MRPSDCRAVPTATRFLRPRGDAPYDRDSGGRVVRVPPPTRRCAVFAEKVLACVVGSSAHAEMRPSLACTRTVSEWFLRPRGDAPVQGGGRGGLGQVPPPTRRCAGADAFQTRPDDGSSAHAEMRPCLDSGRRIRTWFLRPRGDAPPPPSLTAEKRTVPPPTRRCAAREHAAEVAQSGSSAHAEMRRDCAARVSVAGRFLRPRGDAPRACAGRHGRGTVPPPTRRCARPRDFGGISTLGSSAHAEMRPWRSRPRPRAAGFLRPRGDAPPAASMRCIESRVPPPTRRCAGASLMRIRWTVGSSAHAEMRRRSCCGTSGASGFLRPRGDAPRPPPRPRYATPVPPPTRRCAARHPRARAARVGSSAHAEMRRLENRRKKGR